MKKILYMSLAVCLMATWGCSNELEEDLGTLNTRYTGSAPAIEAFLADASGTSSVTIAAAYKYKGSGILRNGMVYSTANETPVVKGASCFTRLIVEQTDTISYKLANLSAGKTYYLRMWSVSNDNDTVYSNIISYTAVAAKPDLETVEIFNRVKVAAIACGRFKKSGDGLKKFGCCIGTKPLPTLADAYIAAVDTAVDATYHGYFGVFFDNLKENTLYHVRAYAITATDTVYGADRIFKTTRGGNCTWSWWSGEEAEAEAAGAAARIREACDSAVANYNRYSNISKHVNINYSPGTPTADCNIDGWMNVGASERYQWVGTIQHEMNHAMGVGTASNWSSFSNSWDKMQALLTLRVMMKDMTQTLTHDALHFWPGGINQREEVTNGVTNRAGTYTISGERMLHTNCMVQNAMRGDGLRSY